MAGSAGISQVPLVSILQQQLYQQCFYSPLNGAALAPEAAPNDLVEQLSAANTTKARWETGWQVNRIGESGQIVAQRFGLTRTFWPGEFVTYEGPGMAPRPGASVSVLFPKDSLNMQPGFYFAFGETAGDQEDDAGRVRFYWNTRAATGWGIPWSTSETPGPLRTGPLGQTFTAAQAALRFS
ncbi:MAG: hypothetical protein KGM47_07740 [Acidobacteriota bacterium]|nr:hypothetical protein [Acidobacteriota bacterium]